MAHEIAEIAPAIDPNRSRLSPARLAEGGFAIFDAEKETRDDRRGEP